MLSSFSLQSLLLCCGLSILSRLLIPYPLMVFQPNADLRPLSIIFSIFFSFSLSPITLWAYIHKLSTQVFISLHCDSPSNTLRLLRNFVFFSTFFSSYRYVYPYLPLLSIHTPRYFARLTIGIPSIVYGFFAVPLILIQADFALFSLRPESLSLYIYWMVLMICCLLPQTTMSSAYALY